MFAYDVLQTLKTSIHALSIIHSHMSHLSRSNRVATKMELFATIVNGFQSLTILTKSSILDVLGVLNSPVPDECATF